VGRPR